MPCHYPEGHEEDWCERHRIDMTLLRALRGERAGDGLKPRADVARA